MKYKTMYRLLVIALICLGFASCDRYEGFGCIAPESHPAVANARSLSAEQWKSVYLEIHKLSEKYAKEKYETHLVRTEIPDNLKFLNAEVIRLHRSKAPYVILANCFDERIELSLSPADSPQASITLYWAEPTNENPYGKGSQILWQSNEEK